MAAARGTRILASHAHETEQILPFRPWIEALRAGHALDTCARSPPVPRPVAPSWPAVPRAGRRRRASAHHGAGTPAPVREPGRRARRARPGGAAARRPRGPALGRRDEPAPRGLRGPSARRAAAAARGLRARRGSRGGAGLTRLVEELAPLPHVEQHGGGRAVGGGHRCPRPGAGAGGSNAARLAEAVDRVWALSEGNPFVIVETMRSLREGRLPDAAGVELPRRVREMIAARLGRLGARAQEVARMASVFTRDFAFPVLQRAMRLSRRETAEAVEELVRHRILDVSGERFDFTHARLRQAVYQALLGPRRQALHAAMGEALEAVYAGPARRALRSARPSLLAGRRARARARPISCTSPARRRAATRWRRPRACSRTRWRSARRLPVEDRGPRRLEVVYRLAHVLALLGRPVEARDLLLQHEDVVDGARPAAAERGLSLLARVSARQSRQQRGGHRGCAPRPRGGRPRRRRRDHGHGLLRARRARAT